MKEQELAKGLDPAICIEFRNAINSSPLALREERYSSLYNLSCAVMDRIDSAVHFLNEHWDYPSSEEEFVCFFVFACILKEGVNSIYEATIGKEPKCNSEKKYFKECCMEAPMYLRDEECPTDEKFVEYIRSLVFAHPYDTSRNRVFKKLYGTQVSPWVVVNKNLFSFYHCSEPIGVRIYSSIIREENDIYDIVFPFQNLKDYLIEKYTCLSEVTRWFEEASESIKNEWKKEKVNRDQSPTNVLHDICKILDTRHESTHGIWRLIGYLECPISDERNTEYVAEYRNYIIDFVPALCDCVDSLDSAKQFELEKQAIEFHPLYMHQMANYQIQKVFECLQDDDIPVGRNEEWALKQANCFYKEFANKWVYMNINCMNYLEIKLLITVSMFMECKEQGRLFV